MKVLKKRGVGRGFSMLRCEDTNKSISFCKSKGEWRCSWYFLESMAWNKLSKKEQQVYYYLYTCLQWSKLHKKDKKYTAMNNGGIECSTTKIREHIPMSSKTMTKAIKSLIGVGLVKLIRVGQNKSCHKYQLLGENLVPKREQRWREFPLKDWYDDAPKHPNNLVGKKSRWKKGVSGNPNFKSHPTKVKGKNDNQTTEVTYNNGNGLQEYID